MAVMAALMLSGFAALAQSCPAPLAEARRLVLVTAKTMNAPTATMRLYERGSAASRGERAATRNRR